MSLEETTHRNHRAPRGTYALLAASQRELETVNTLHRTHLPLPFPGRPIKSFAILPGLHIISPPCFVLLEDPGDAFNMTSLRRHNRDRPVAAAMILVSVITAIALFQHVPVTASRGAGKVELRSRAFQEQAVGCRAVHRATDQCAFVRTKCEDDEAGLLPYLTFYYCTLGGARPVAFVLLATWLGLLFTTIGIAASDFFSVNLSTIATVLGLSESLAGVTFLAFGNGSPDVFSTFAAMGSNSGSMAVGELVGAAGFITAVVAGSMALVREFKVSRRTFVRDIVFFIVAVSFTMVFLADGELHLWECFVMIGYYIFYVIVVVGWHWWTARRRRQRILAAATQSHLYGVSGYGSAELEPYRDEFEENDNEAAPMAAGRLPNISEPADITVLELGPRIEVDGVRTSPESPDVDDEEQGLHVAAEMASSMRVNRPRWARNNSTITPIRPSLVGVLEFRSVLSSLQKERNMKLGPLHSRSQSLNQPYSTPDESRGRSRVKSLSLEMGSTTQDRPFSSANSSWIARIASLARPEASSQPGTRASSVARTVDGRLAPPFEGPTSDFLQSPTQPRQPLKLRTPSPSGRSSRLSSPPMSPFPVISESPGFLSPRHEPLTPFPCPAPSEERHHSLPPLHIQVENHNHRPVSWWPYGLLPAPQVLLATFFPTLQGWKEKTLWDKIVSLASLPSIFFLVVTLPVVETEKETNEASLEAEDLILPSPALPTSAGSVPNGAEPRPESEWQAYRRRTRSATSRSSRPSLSPSISSSHIPAGQLTSQSPLIPLGHQESQATTLIPLTQSQLPKSDSFTPSPERASSVSPTGWNRWLVSLQLFTGPLFVALILWANMAAGDDKLENPGKTFVKFILYSLTVSLCLFATLLVTTDPDTKPRFQYLLCFLGFIISVAWISTIAGEVVGVLKSFGVILDISEAILGLTVFAVGNSLGDLVADVTVARLGYPVMAL